MKIYGDHSDFSVIRKDFRLAHFVLNVALLPNLFTNDKRKHDESLRDFDNGFICVFGMLLLMKLLSQFYGSSLTFHFDDLFVDGTIQGKYRFVCEL